MGRALHGLLPTGSGRIAHILGCMAFKEPTRTWKNLLSLSYSSKAVLCEAKALVAGDFNISLFKVPSLAMCMEQRNGWILNRPLLLARAGSPQVLGTLVGLLMMPRKARWLSPLLSIFWCIMKGGLNHI